MVGCVGAGGGLGDHGARRAPAHIGTGRAGRAHAEHPGATPPGVGREASRDGHDNGHQAGAVAGETSPDRDDNDDHDCSRPTHADLGHGRRQCHARSRAGRESRRVAHHQIETGSVTDPERGNVNITPSTEMRGVRGLASSIKSGLLLTAAAWFVSRAVVGVSDAGARNPVNIRGTTWSRFDSLNYLDIARHGVTFGKCAHFHFVGRPILYGQKWCGTAAWLPGYPWLIRALHATGVGLNASGVLIAWIATAVALFLAWYGWGRDLSHGRAFLVLLLIGLFPGAVYNFALFPTSVALALVLGALVAANRRRFVVAALLMLGSGLCYPSAWFAAAGFAVALVVVAHRFTPSRQVERALSGLLALSSLLVLMLISKPWNAFFLIDRQSAVRANGFPGQEFLRLLFTHDTVSQRLIGIFYGWVLAAQASIAMVLVTVACAIAIRSWRSTSPDVSLVYPAAVGAAVFLGVVAANANGGAWNRSIVLAAPSAVCLRRVPLAWLLAMVVGVGAVTAVLSSAFFDGRLV
jgi:hypothetical protein